MGIYNIQVTQPCSTLSGEEDIFLSNALPFSSSQNYSHTIPDFEARIFLHFTARVGDVALRWAGM
jgi:hypothetical protein